MYTLSDLRDPLPTQNEWCLNISTDIYTTTFLAFRIFAIYYYFFFFFFANGTL
jgi:hypothetical protein